MGAGLNPKPSRLAFFPPCSTPGPPPPRTVRNVALHAGHLSSSTMARRARRDLVDRRHARTGRQRRARSAKTRAPCPPPLHPSHFPVHFPPESASGFFEIPPALFGVQGRGGGRCRRWKVFGRRHFERSASRRRCCQSGRARTKGRWTQRGWTGIELDHLVRDLAPLHQIFTQCGLASWG